MPIDSMATSVLTNEGSSSILSSTSSTSTVSTSSSLSSSFLIGTLQLYLTTNAAAVNAAGRAILELIVSSGIGIGAIHFKLLNSSTMKALSATSYTILLPLFLGTNIMKTITNYGLSKSSLAVPLLAATQSFLLYLITTQLIFPMVNIVGDSNDDARGVAVCSSFGNGGVVPLIFCESLFGTNYIADGGDPNLFAISTGFVALFLVGWSPFFWGFGRAILLGKKKEYTTTTATTKINRMIAKVRSLIPPPVIGTFMGMAFSTIPFLRPLFLSSPGNSNKTRKMKKPIFGVVFDTAQNFGKAASPLSLLVLVSSLAVGAGFGGGDGGGGGGGTQLPNQQDQDHPQQQQQQQQLVSTTSKSSLSTKSASASESTAAVAIDEIPFWKRWAIVSVVRFVISPVVMYGLLTLFSSPLVGLIESPFATAATSSSSSSSSSSYTSMLWFICILESCMPPAQNQVTLLHVANKTKKANEMATFLFSIYATSIIPLVVLISFALQKFQLI